MKKLPLHVKIIIGLVLGIIWAFASSALGWNQFTINWIDPFGQIFIRLLKSIAVPLVLFSISVSWASCTLYEPWTHTEWGYGSIELASKQRLFISSS